MQQQLFKIKPNKKKRSKIINRTNGTKGRKSRYELLKRKLDDDCFFNGNWKEYDTSKISKKKKINFIDLFSGAGGISLGFRNVGFNKIFSVEIDSDASNTIQQNFPESKHFNKPIEQLSQSEIEKVVKNKEIHVICGGPPCQGFSVAGLRNPNDKRNQLFKEYIRIVNYLKPKIVMLENVPGILTMESGKVYREIIDQFGEIGYPNMSVRILEAAEFGVPQLRTRAIFIGNRMGRKNPYPKPILKKADYVPIEKAIDDLKKVKFNKSTNHIGTKHSKKFIERIASVPPGKSLYKSYQDAFKRQYKGVPSMAIKENHGGVHIHYELNRVLTAREMARLQTFPDDFIFSGSHKRAYWQIGNAVPCLLAEHIGRAILKGLESKYEPPPVL